MVLFKTLIVIVLCFCDCLCKYTNLPIFVGNTSSNINKSVEPLQQIKTLSGYNTRRKSIDLIGPFDLSRSSKAKSNPIEHDNGATAEKLKLNLENTHASTNIPKFINRTTKIIEIDLHNKFGANTTLKSNIIVDIIPSTLSSNSKIETLENGIESDNKTDHKVLIHLESTICINSTASNSIENNCSKNNISSVNDFRTETTKETESDFLINENAKILENENKENDTFTPNYKTKYTNESSYVTESNIYNSNIYSISSSNNRLYENIFRRPKNKTVVVNGTESTWPVKHAAILEGDLVLGGLMMVHSREDSVTCGPVMPQGGVQALEAMLYTLDVININRLLPGITLGAHVLDDCDTDTYGLEIAVDFIKGA